MGIQTALAPNSLLNNLFASEQKFKTLSDVINQDHLNYTVSKEQMYIKTGDEYQDVRAWCTVKNDGTFFSTVGDRYEVLQNSEALEFADELCQAVGGEYTGGIALKQGALFGVNISLGNIVLPGDDKIQKNLLIMNSFDGSTPISGIMLPFRWYCFNQLSTNMKDEIRLSIRHTQSAKSRLSNTDQIIMNVMSYYKNIEETLTKFQNKQISREEALKLLQALYGVTDQDTQDFYDGLHKKQPRWVNQLNDIMYRWEKNVDNIPTGLENTLYSVFNAVNGYIQHDRTVKNQDDEDNRIVNNMFGNNHKDLVNTYSIAIQFMEGNLELPADPYLLRV